MSPLTEHPTRGFTLTEIMVTVTLTGLFFAGAMPFLLTNTRYLYTSEQKLLINGDIRDVTNELVETARASNYFVLYESFHSQTVNSSTISRDANGTGTVNMNDRRQSGEDGTFIVFVFYEDPFYDSRLYDANPANDPSIMGVRIERMVGYWLAANRRIAGENALYVFDTDDYRTAGAASWTTPWGTTLPISTNAGATIESMLPAATSAWATNAGFDMIVNDLRGLSDNGLLFVNYQNRSALVRAKILHGNQAKRVTNTYNFTITPRG